MPVSSRRAMRIAFNSVLLSPVIPTTIHRDGRDRPGQRTRWSQKVIVPASVFYAGRVSASRPCVTELGIDSFHHQ